MSESDVWSEKASGIIRAELKRRKIGHAELAERLTHDGSPISAKALGNKLSRGGFSALFFLQALALIGVRTIRLEDD